LSGALLFDKEAFGLYTLRGYSIREGEETMKPVPQEVKSDLLVRLRRTEGQVRGIQRMIEEDRDCQEVLQQLSAVRSALLNTSTALARHFALQCLHETEGGLKDEELVEQLLMVFSKV
jgi:CsoR family transcriptional regulator, copper-sensing transcriptional repressor